MRAHRRVAALVGVALLAGVLAGCGEDDDVAEEVLAAIAATRTEPYRFTYTEKRPDESRRVQGLVEDDFRYKARLTQGSVTVLDEVVSDDAIAVRFAEPAAIGNFVDDAEAEVADTSTALRGISVVDALQARRWVLDAAGAPATTSAARSVNALGADPIFDSLTALDYVEQAMSESFEVKEFSEDDLNPAYRTSEDAFPVPEEGSGVTRYDLVRPFLPAPGNTSGSGDDDVPKTKHFRKMAIYVKDGRILRVVERVELTGKSADDFVGYIGRFLDEVGAPDEALEEFDAEIEAARAGGAEAFSDFLLGGFNEFLAVFGGDPINARVMVLDLQDVGDTAIRAELPTDAIAGSLAILRDRGVKSVVPSGGPAPATGASAGATTRTTVAGAGPAPTVSVPAPAEG